MRVRKQDSSGDMLFGHGQRDYWNNQPEGVAQLAMTRLQLYKGDWFLDVSAGMPWRTEVLGKYTEGSRDPAILNRIAGTQGLLSVVSYSSQENRDTRALAVQVTIDTVYGRTGLSASTPVSGQDVRSGR